METKKIKWVIAHLPEYLFVRTAKAFKQELEKIVPGQFEIEILRASEYVSKYKKHQELTSLDDLSSDNNHAYETFFKAIEDADIEMGQFQITELGSRFHDQLMVFDMPFMFDNHDHVNRVVEGPIGEELLQGLEQKSGMKGLSYTYSGGYRVFGSHQPINSLEDITKVATSKSVLGDTIQTALGAEVVNQSSYLSTRENLPNNDIPVVEATYLRFNDNVKYILKTNHSLFVTNIVISKNFWNTLSAEQQDAIKLAAKNAAKQERTWSIEDAEEFEKSSNKTGKTIKNITEEENELFRKNAQRMYVKYHWMFKDNLIPRIKKLS